MAEHDLLGRFLWHELLTSDPAAARVFYPPITGWTVAFFEEAESRYWLWMRGETMVGGMMAMPSRLQAAGAPAHWVTYIGTPDVDDTARRAFDLGAHIVLGPETIPEFGRFAILSDPQQAIFGICALDSPLPETGATPGDFSWHELATLDGAAAVRFYTELFGWSDAGEVDMGAMGTYRRFSRPAIGAIGGIYDLPAERRTSPNWLTYVRVTDLDDAIERVATHGGRVLSGPMEVPGGDHVAQLLDPQGAAFALHELAGRG